MDKIAEIDKQNYERIRANVSKFINSCAEKYDSEDSLLLDIAPQDHEGAHPYFKKAQLHTLDIDPESGATYVADLCVNNESLIESNKFDYIVCTEVLEHTLQPFNAVDEIERILKVGGIAFVSTPFNFRIHGPLPDCWRFTEHGLRALFKNFEIISLTGLDLEDRFLMPIHYTTIIKKIRDE